MLLTSVFTILFVTLAIVSFIPATNVSLLRWVRLSSSGLIIFLVLSCLLLFYFECDLYHFQHVIILGVDEVSTFFFLLGTFLIFSCVLLVWNIELLKEYLIALLLTNLFLLYVFSALDLLVFYIALETFLVPMYLLMGLWGATERKTLYMFIGLWDSRETQIRVVYLFFLYNLVGSLLVLLRLLYMYIYIYLCIYNNIYIHMNILYLST
jgi:NADH:ubiquinone oxidoreductase subunit 4 (subunit M)